jgi:hypothetical protein
VTTGADAGELIVVVAAVVDVTVLEEALVVAGCTVTEEVAVALFPDPSVAVKTTFVVPAANELGAFVAITGARSTMSVATAPSRNFAIAGLLCEEVFALSASTPIAAGTVSSGGVVSATFTVKNPSPTLPLLSRAIQPTCVNPSGNSEP